MFCLYFVYRTKTNTFRTDLTNDDQKPYAFAPTYGYGSTAFHRHMISVFPPYSNTLENMLADYAVTEIGCFDDYLDAAPNAKTIRGNDITTFLLHVAQCITLNHFFGYSNTYCRGTAEVIIFKVRFQGY